VSDNHRQKSKLYSNFLKACTLAKDENNIATYVTSINTVFIILKCVCSKTTPETVHKESNPPKLREIFILILISKNEKNYVLTKFPPVPVSNRQIANN